MKLKNGEMIDRIRSISYSIFGNEDQHQNLRRLIVEYVYQNFNLFENSIPEKYLNLGVNGSAAYRSDMLGINSGGVGRYGGQAEQFGFNHMLPQNISHRIDLMIYSNYGNNYGYTEGDRACSPNATTRILFNGINHYQVLIGQAQEYPFTRDQAVSAINSYASRRSDTHIQQTQVFINNQVI